jgi:hypothetical protein
MGIMLTLLVWKLPFHIVLLLFLRNNISYVVPSQGLVSDLAGLCCTLCHHPIDQVSGTVMIMKIKLQV